MRPTINYRKVTLWGLVIYIINSLLGNMLYMNPVVANLFAQYEGHPTMKPMEVFGGLGTWLLFNQIFSLAFFILFIALFLLLYPSLPGTGWHKGLFYGVMIGVVKAVPEAFNQWMLFNYPNVLIQVQLVNTLISLAILGLITAMVFARFRVIGQPNDKETETTWRSGRTASAHR